MIAHFPVQVGAARKIAHLTIDRDTGLVTLRFHHERRRYELHISEVAEMVHRRVAQQIVREAAKAKALKRAGGAR